MLDLRHFCDQMCAVGCWTRFMSNPYQLLLCILGEEVPMKCPLSIRKPHPLPSYPNSLSLLWANVLDWWPLCPIGKGRRWWGWKGGVFSQAASAVPLICLWVSAESSASALIRCHLSSHWVRQKKGAEWGEKSGKLPQREEGQKRKQEKYIFLSRLFIKNIFFAVFCSSKTLILVLSHP